MDYRDVFDFARMANVAALRLSYTATSPRLTEAQRNLESEGAQAAYETCASLMLLGIALQRGAEQA